MQRTVSQGVACCVRMIREMIGGSASVGHLHEKAEWGEAHLYAALADFSEGDATFDFADLARLDASHARCVELLAEIHGSVRAGMEKQVGRAH